jgi:hypothetical protein
MNKVLAVYRYEVRPGRMADFAAKLREAAAPKFNSPVMPLGARLLRSTVPGPDTGGVTLVLEYADMAAFGARNAWESANSEWRRLFAAAPDSPEKLISVELLTEIPFSGE